MQEPGRDKANTRAEGLLSTARELAEEHAKTVIPEGVAGP